MIKKQKKEGMNKKTKKTESKEGDQNNAGKNS